MEKLLVMYVAAQLAQAAAGSAAPAGSLPISADISDANVRAKNLMVWEDFRIFYHAILKALADDNPDTGWPPPKLDAGTVSSVVGKVLRGVAAVAPVPHLPDPGK